MVKTVIWSKPAQKHLENVYKFILEDSFQNAVKVKAELLNSTKVLSLEYEKFPLDKYRLINDGSFRAYEIYNYRVSYQIKSKEILILKIRHNKRKPIFK